MSSAVRLSICVSIRMKRYTFDCFFKYIAYRPGTPAACSQQHHCNQYMFNNNDEKRHSMASSLPLITLHHATQCNTQVCNVHSCFLYCYAKWTRGTCSHVNNELHSKNSREKNLITGRQSNVTGNYQPTNLE